MNEQDLINMTNAVTRTPIGREALVDEQLRRNRYVVVRSVHE